MRVAKPKGELWRTIFTCCDSSGHFSINGFGEWASKACEIF